MLADARDREHVLGGFRYHACILPKAASPLDPTPPSLALKQLVTLLDRMNLLVDAMQRPTCPQGP